MRNNKRLEKDDEDKHTVYRGKIKTTAAQDKQLERLGKASPRLTMPLA
jgi:hypothetical protein